MTYAKYSLLAAASALALALAAPAYAQGVNPPDQPSGGHTDDNVAAATGGLQGSVTGEGNMNGPFRNGQPDSPYPTNKEQANMRGVGSHYDPNAPTPAYVGQGAAQ